MAGAGQANGVAAETAAGAGGHAAAGHAAGDAAAGIGHAGVSTGGASSNNHAAHPPAETAVQPGPAAEDVLAYQPRAAQDAPRPRPDTASAARVFDAATTRRRSVIFEEDDELDVPDFLK